MARSLRMLVLALLTSSSVASLISASARPASITCNLETVPTDSPAENYASYCRCAGPNASGSAFFPAVTPSPSPTSPNDQLFCPYVATDLATIPPLKPTPFTCNVAFASQGFTVPDRWCACTAGTTTNTYSTKFRVEPTGTGNPACDFKQDELPAGTIQPSSAHCVIAAAVPSVPGIPGSGKFYDQLAWCACGDNAPHPLITDAPVPSAACDYTTEPAERVTPHPISSTSCELRSAVSTSSTIPYCGCEGAGTSINFPPQTAGASSCVFSAVPTETATLPSNLGTECSEATFIYGCDFDGQTKVKFHSRPQKKSHADACIDSY